MTEAAGIIEYPAAFIITNRLFHMK